MYPPSWGGGYCFRPVGLSVRLSQKFVVQPLHLKWNAIIYRVLVHFHIEYFIKIFVGEGDICVCFKISFD